MRESMRLILCMMIIIAIFSSRGPHIRAEERQEREELKHTGPKVTFYVQGSYEMNLNNPESGLVDYRFLNQRSNFLSPDLLELRVNQEPERGALGYRIKLTGGEISRRIHARGLGTFDDRGDFTEFFIACVLPVGKGLKLDAGKMNTHLGAESLEAIYNPNYSRSFLWLYAEPTTHTGARLTWAPTPQASFQCHVYNGWDNFNDNNEAKSLGLTLALTQDERTAMYFNLLNGPEQDNNSVDSRLLFDWVGSFRFSERFSLLANYDYGREQNYPASGENAIWHGFSLIGSYAFSDSFSLAVRGETFSDPQGYRTGFPQVLKELTLTPQFKVGSNMSIWPEFRYDWSDVKSFGGGASDTQSVIGVGVTFSF